MTHNASRALLALVATLVPACAPTARDILPAGRYAARAWLGDRPDSVAGEVTVVAAEGMQLRLSGTGVAQPVSGIVVASTHASTPYGPAPDHIDGGRYTAPFGEWTYGIWRSRVGDSLFVTLTIGRLTASRRHAIALMTKSPRDSLAHVVLLLEPL